MSATRSAPRQCPVCGDQLLLTRLSCESCSTELSGRFESCEFCSLTAEDRQMLKVFLASRGNMKDLERHLGVSYPTARARFDGLLQKLGIDPNNPAYGSWVEEKAHQGWTPQNRADWDAFFRNNPNPTRLDVYKFGTEMGQKYGYGTHFPTGGPAPVTPLPDPWGGNGGPPLGPENW